MKIVIETAQPELGEQMSAKYFQYTVKHWNVTGYTWDVLCMCTKKSFRLKLDWPFLDCSRSTMNGLIKKAGV